MRNNENRYSLATLIGEHSLDEVDVNLASRDDFLEHGSQKFFRMSVLESTLLSLDNTTTKRHQLPPCRQTNHTGLTLVTAVRTAATITTSSAELSRSFARPKEGIELAIDCRVEDMVIVVGMMCLEGISRATGVGTMDDYYMVSFVIRPNG
jgi:hypothetical protein